MKTKKILTLSKMKKDENDVNQQKEERHQYRVKILQKIEELEREGKFDVDAEEVNGKLISGNVELIVIVHSASDVQMITAGNSEIEGVVSLCVRQASARSSAAGNVEVNEAPKKGLDLTNSLGFMIYKTLTSGTLLAGLIQSGSFTLFVM